MKKSYFLMATAAALFAACAETDFVNEATVQDAPKAIGFENHVGKSTRAAITGKSDLQNATGGFTVWGYKTNLAAPDWTNQTQVFNEQDVTWTDGTWQYAPLQYWDKLSTYKFYAAAPAGGGAYSIDGATGYITIPNVASAKYTDSKDYLVTRGATNQDGTNNATVMFDLHHTMTKVVVKLQRTVAEEITVSALSMSGWDNAEGTFTQNSASTPNDAFNVSEWDLDDTAVPGNVTLVGTGCGDPAVTLSSDAAVTVQDYYIMVPQTIAANTLKFTLSYTINGQAYTNHVGTIVAAQTWGTDTEVTYTVKVGPAAIAFDVNNICGWCNHGSGETNVE